MPERIQAKAASINSSPGVLEIVLTFVGDDGVQRQVGFAYNGDKAHKFACELVRQHERQIRTDERRCLEEAAKEEHAKPPKPTEPDPEDTAPGGGL